VEFENENFFFKKLLLLVKLDSIFFA